VVERGGGIELFGRGGQIEAPALLRQFGRSQVDGDAAQEKLELGAEQRRCGSGPLLSFTVAAVLRSVRYKPVSINGIATHKLFHPRLHPSTSVRTF
jgi:hypothetical protein